LQITEETAMDRPQPSPSAIPSAAPGAAVAPVRARSVGLLLGPVLFCAMLFLPPPTGLEPAGWRVAAVAVLMAVLWMTEAVPIPVTGLLPLALFPTLGIASGAATSAPYADPLIFLFLGGFLIALGLERWNLHRRIALGVVALVGTRPAALVGGFMLATAFLSMWVSNTATAVMMLPSGCPSSGCSRARARKRAASASRCCSASPMRRASAGSRRSSARRPTRCSRPS
jgi:sodium-dependent dicarboxylate transporter 2/3/5